MARVEIDEITQRRDNLDRLYVLPNATVTVLDKNNDVATLYDARSGGSTIPNPTTSDDSGRIDGTGSGAFIDYNDLPATLQVSHDLFDSYEQQFQAAYVVNNFGSGGATGWFDVTDPLYGADPTGVADSTAEIQAAIDACEAAGGGIVYFPPGTYLVPPVAMNTDVSAITVPSGVSLLGVKGVSVITGDSVAAVAYESFIGVGDLAAPASNVAIRDIVIDGQVADSTHSDEYVMGIAPWSTCSDLEVSGVEFRNLKGDGVNNSEGQASGGDSTRISIHHCHFHGNVGQAVLLSGASYCSITDNVIRAPQHPAPGGIESIWLTGSEFTVSRNSSKGLGPGVTLPTANNTVVEDNVFEPEPGGQGCIIGGDFTNVRIANNFLNGTASNITGIHTEGAVTGLQIIGNRIKRGTGTTAPAGISLVDTGPDANNVVIEGNLIDGPTAGISTTQADLDLRIAGSRWTISGNNLRSVSTSILVKGDKVTITGNSCNGGIQVNDGDDPVITGNWAIAQGEVYAVGGNNALWMANVARAVVVGNHLTAVTNETVFHAFGNVTNLLYAGNVVSTTGTYVTDTDAGNSNNQYRMNMEVGGGSNSISSTSSSRVAL